MPGFRFLRAFNDPAVAGYAGSKTRIGRNALPYFPSDKLSDRFLRELAATRALPLKEIVEAFEFFAVARKYVRTSTVADVCSGHGLVGILFVLMQPEVQQAVLCDKRKPDGYTRVLKAATRVAPWITEHVRFVVGPLEQAFEHVPKHSGVLAVHACGFLTDRSFELAARIEGPFAALPCCRDHSESKAPQGLRHALGEDVAYDVHRTYTMEQRGYRVRWRDIPREITPMNRVLIASPKVRIPIAVAR